MRPNNQRTRFGRQPDTSVLSSMDRALRPQDAPTGANSEAGKAIIRQITASARAQMEQIKQAREPSSQGANP